MLATIAKSCNYRIDSGLLKVLLVAEVEEIVDVIVRGGENTQNQKLTFKQEKKNKPDRKEHQA